MTPAELCRAQGWDDDPMSLSVAADILAACPDLAAARVRWADDDPGPVRGPKAHAVWIDEVPRGAGN